MTMYNSTKTVNQHKIPNTSKLLCLDPEKTENLKRPITTKETKSVSPSVPNPFFPLPKLRAGSDSFPIKFN